MCPWSRTFNLSISYELIRAFTFVARPRFGSYPPKRKSKRKSNKWNDVTYFGKKLKSTEILKSLVCTCWI